MLLAACVVVLELGSYIRSLLSFLLAISVIYTSIHLQYYSKYNLQVFETIMTRFDTIKYLLLWVISLLFF
jgi:thioredoxin-related protein